MSTLPVLNDQGEKIAVDISELPKPDEEILIETNKSKEAIKSNKEETTKESTKDNKKESISKETSVKVEVGLSPNDINKSTTKPSKVENVEEGVRSKIVEVEVTQ